MNGAMHHRCTHLKYLSHLYTAPYDVQEAAINPIKYCHDALIQLPVCQGLVLTVCVVKHKQAL